MTSRNRGQLVEFDSVDPEVIFFGKAATTNDYFTLTENETLYTLDGAFVSGFMELTWTTKGSGIGDTDPVRITLGATSQMKLDLASVTSMVVDIVSTDKMDLPANGNVFTADWDGDGFVLYSNLQLAAGSGAATVTLKGVDVAASGSMKLTFAGSRKEESA